MRQNEHQAPIVAIGEDTAGQSEQEPRDKAHQPEQPKLEWVSRELEDLPSGRATMDLRPCLGKDFRTPDEPEVVVAEHPIGALMWWRWVCAKCTAGHVGRLCRMWRASAALSRPMLGTRDFRW